MSKYRLLLFFILALLLALIPVSYRLSTNAVFSLASPTQSECRIVQHDLGEACVPLHPKRVVVLGGLDAVLALGVKPVGAEGTIESFYEAAFSKADLAAIEPIGFSETGVDLEAILKLKPDLILQLAFWNYVSPTYDLLSKTIPMVVVMNQTEAEWKSVFLKYAEALGKTREANQILASYHARLAEFQARMGDRLNQIKVSLVRVFPLGLSFYLKTSFPGSIVAETGLQRPPVQDVTSPQALYIDVNPEMLDVLDGDVMFVWSFGYNAPMIRTAQSVLKRLQSDSLWSQLKVVQQKQVYEVSSSTWMGYGPIAANLVVDDLFKYFLGEPSS
ncbi:iron-siderophore ABC transporter substrate-binding protein [Microcoleus sp. FACHB-1515]|uniref:ABC transporter substrate-binding protein n=1 Tax=Cyanophyceae TaxID=3028117 RepID=UPI0016892CAF|nr:iron-siderophore ABC transporter substrate-binding protein [Microcoleus sp. FACHB-1515]MBD2091396.1 iron-siderophore ABC transporter substrate-binding protein [Microcoleus sp. FACHB-1515]